MDFDRINAMVDELNANFNIVESETALLRKSNLDENVALFKQVYEYLENWASLFKKVDAGETWTRLRTATNDRNEYGFTFTFDRGILLSFDKTNSGGSHGVKMFGSINRDYYTHWLFKDVIVPAIKSFDYDFVEKHLAEDLNIRIAEKAEQLEKAYHDATEGRW